MDEGGMGAVFRAVDTERGDPVAIKVLLPDLAKETRHIARFYREAEAAMALKHPHIVETRSVCGPNEDFCWFAMELLEGASLHQRQEKGETFTPIEVIRIGRQILSALSAAHKIGVLHRDLKPGNVMLLEGQGATLAKLVDFGIAVFTSSETYTRLTATGMILGTPAYMPPEQVCGDPLDERADVYSLAATLHTILVGEPPFGRGNWGEILPRILTGNRITLKQRDGVDPMLAQVIEQGLATEPDARWGSAREMEMALGALDSGGKRTILEWRKPPGIGSLRLENFDDTGPGFEATGEMKFEGPFPGTRETPSSQPPPMDPRPEPEEVAPAAVADEITADPPPYRPSEAVVLPTQGRVPMIAALSLVALLIVGVAGAWAIGSSGAATDETPTAAVEPEPEPILPAVVPELDTPLPEGVVPPEPAAEVGEEEGGGEDAITEAPRAERSVRGRARRRVASVASGAMEEWKEEEEETAAMTPSPRPDPPAPMGPAPIMVNVSGSEMGVRVVAPGSPSGIEETDGTHGPMVQIRTLPRR